MYLVRRHHRLYTQTGSDPMHLLTSVNVGDKGSHLTLAIRNNTITFSLLQDDDAGKDPGDKKRTQA